MGTSRGKGEVGGMAMGVEVLDYLGQGSWG